MPASENELDHERSAVIMVTIPAIIAIILAILYHLDGIKDWSWPEKMEKPKLVHSPVVQAFIRRQPK